MTDNLWSRRSRERHQALYDAEYAKQLERIERIRSAVSASLPPAAAAATLEPRAGLAARGRRDVRPAPAAPPRRWDTAPARSRAGAGRPRAADRGAVTPRPNARPVRRMPALFAVGDAGRRTSPSAPSRRSQPRAPGGRGAG